MKQRSMQMPHGPVAQFQMNASARTVDFSRPAPDEPVEYRRTCFHPDGCGAEPEGDDALLCAFHASVMELSEMVRERKYASAIPVSGFGLLRPFHEEEYLTEYRAVPEAKRRANHTRAEWRKRNRERNNALRRAYVKNPEVKERHRIAQKERRAMKRLAASGSTSSSVGAAR
jgi:hypothetical protein